MLKILLIKRGAIGDLLMATPFIRQLKTQVNCQLDIIVGVSASCALKDNPYLDEQIILPDSYFNLRGVWQLAKFLYSRRKSYDCVFVLDKHWYFNLMVNLLKAKRIGFVREWISRLWLTKYVVYDEVNRYHGLYYLDLLALSGLAKVNYTDLSLDLLVNNEAVAKVDDYLVRQGLTQFALVVNSGGNNAYEHNGVRMLPSTKILELLQKLLLENEYVVLAGGVVDFINNQQYIKQLDNDPRLLNVAGKFDLAASSYLVAKAKHFYTTDCGAMHLGVVNQLLARMTVFFGPTNPAHILPLSYLSTSVIWQDQPIYDPQYQLSGKKPPAVFFTKLDISKLDDGLNAN